MRRARSLVLSMELPLEDIWTDAQTQFYAAIEIQRVWRGFLARLTTVCVMVMGYNQDWMIVATYLLKRRMLRQPNLSVPTRANLRR